MPAGGANVLQLWGCKRIKLQLSVPPLHTPDTQPSLPSFPLGVMPAEKSPGAGRSELRDISCSSPCAMEWILCEIVWALLAWFNCIILQPCSPRDFKEKQHKSFTCPTALSRFKAYAVWVGLEFIWKPSYTGTIYPQRSAVYIVLINVVIDLFCDCTGLVYTGLECAIFQEWLTSFFID